MNLSHIPRPHLAVTLSDAIDHLLGGQISDIDRQAFTPKAGLNVVEQSWQIDPRCIDFVNHDHATQSTGLSPMHHATCGEFNAFGGIDHHRHRFNCIKSPNRLPHEIGVSGGIEHVDASVIVFQMSHSHFDRVQVLFFLGVVVTDGVAFFNRSCLVNGTRLSQQGLDEGGFASPAMAYPGHSTQRFRGIGVVVHECLSDLKQGTPTRGHPLGPV